MDSNWMTVLSAGCLGLSLGGILLALRSRVEAAGHLILVFICFAALSGLPVLVSIDLTYAIAVMPWILPALLCASPAVYFYVRARSLSRPFGRTDWPHAILPTLACLLAAGVSGLPDNAQRSIFIGGQLPPGLMPAFLMFGVFLLVVTAPFVSAAYLVFSLRALRVYRRWLRQNLSNTDRHELRWLDGLVVCLCFLGGLTGLALLSDNLGPGLWVSGEWVLVVAALTLLLLNSFALVPAPRDRPGTVARFQKRYENSGLSDDAALDISRRLEATMREEALYLDPNLSLDRLARHVRCAPDHVSQTLNAYMGTNFFDYVARWRVRAAKAMLVNQEATVLQIAIDVGFNSRSTFYKAFKRETGLTPLQFRQAGKSV